MEPVMVKDEQKENAAMKENVLRDATRTGERVVERLAASKEAVSDALEDGRSAVKHLLKRTRNTAEDLMDDATHNIKRFPIGSVAMAFGVGAMLGMAFGRFARR